MDAGSERVNAGASKRALPFVSQRRDHNEIFVLASVNEFPRIIASANRGASWNVTNFLPSQKNAK